MAKAIKIFDGVFVTDDKGERFYKDFDVFNEELLCDDKTKGEIIRTLIACGKVDLSEFTNDKSLLILSLYSLKEMGK